MYKISNIGALVILTIVVLTGCTLRYEPKLQKFDVYTNDIQVSQDACINIITPENAGFIEVENLNLMSLKGLDMQFNLDDAYLLIKQLFGEALQTGNLSCDKSIKLVIDKVQYETWGGLVNGAYIYFTVETSSGTRKRFKTQDQSGVSFDRAVSGNLSRVVEAILTDTEIQKFINE